MLCSETVFYPYSHVQTACFLDTSGCAQCGEGMGRELGVLRRLHQCQRNLKRNSIVILSKRSIAVVQRVSVGIYVFVDSINACVDNIVVCVYDISGSITFVGLLLNGYHHFFVHANLCNVFQRKLTGNRVGKCAQELSELEHDQGLIRVKEVIKDVDSGVGLCLEHDSQVFSAF